MVLLTTTQNIENRLIEKNLGIVRGSSVRAKWFGKDILTGFRNLVGGELKEYKELLDESREKAIEEMISYSQKLGADAIVSVRFETSTISQGASEILVYGTAVKLK